MPPWYPLFAVVFVAQLLGRAVLKHRSGLSHQWLPTPLLSPQSRLWRRCHVENLVRYTPRHISLYSFHILRDNVPSGNCGKVHD
jgi:hypothetical protein